MNKPLLPIITFKNMISDEKKVETAYFRIFEIARKNILMKRMLTSPMSQTYTEIHNEKSISNNRGGSQNVAS
ncbi:MAG TPA: hypothetical protein HA367_09130 [Candidatus Methanofastidiosum sp.]|nr:hypothetical protein [Methanofastidiosum sp.]